MIYPALRTGLDMMKASETDRVQRMINEGMSEDEVVAAGPTRDFTPTWGENSEGFVRAVYQSLVGQR